MNSFMAGLTRYFLVTIGTTHCRANGTRHRLRRVQGSPMVVSKVQCTSGSDSNDTLTVTGTPLGLVLESCPLGCGCALSETDKHARALTPDTPTRHLVALENMVTVPLASTDTPFPWGKTTSQSNDSSLSRCQWHLRKNLNQQQHLPRN